MLSKEAIEKLKEQAKRAEAKGNFNTAHHQMLAQINESVEGVIPRNAKKALRSNK